MAGGEGRGLGPLGEKKGAMGFTSKRATLYVLHFCRLQARSQVFFYRKVPSNELTDPNEAEGARLFDGGGGGDLMIVRDCISCVLKAA